jgi:hypothetical protein
VAGFSGARNGFDRGIGDRGSEAGRAGPAVRVLISYAHDNDGHVGRVRLFTHLSYDLREMTARLSGHACTIRHA